MEELTGLLDFVRLSSGTSFRSCEPEIIELMRQIDIMIEDKASQWHHQIIQLENDLQLKTTENEQLSKKLEASRNEVKVLQKQLANEKKQNSDRMTQYDTEIEKLKSELNKLKCKFKKNTSKKSKDDNGCVEDRKDSFFSMNKDSLSMNKVNFDSKGEEESSSLLEKSICSLSSCLYDTNKALDKRVDELQVSRMQLESLYFENTILRSFLHQRGIINFLGNDEEQTSFTEMEMKREDELRDQIKSRIDEFISNTYD